MGYSTLVNEVINTPTVSFNTPISALYYGVRRCNLGPSPAKQHLHACALEKVQRKAAYWVMKDYNRYSNVFDMLATCYCYTMHGHEWFA